MTQRERWEMNNPGRVAILQPFGTANKAYFEWLESENDKLRGMIGARIMDVVNATHVDNLCKESRPSVEVTDELQQLMNEWFIWVSKTFPSTTSLSHARHLQKEAAELCEVLIESPIESPLNQSLRYEFADCFILLLNTASKCGFTIRELMDCGIEKMEINKKRKWGKPDKDGVIEHVRDRLTQPQSDAKNTTL